MHITEWFRINPADTAEQVKAKVEKLFERVATLEDEVKKLKAKENLIALDEKLSEEIGKKFKARKITNEKS